MKAFRIAGTIKVVLYLIMFTFALTACDNGQGMMYGGGRSMYMGNWNWVLILIGIIIGFLLGYLVARRRR
jgi:hypothetical protein